MKKNDGQCMTEFTILDGEALALVAGGSSLAGRQASTHLSNQVEQFTHAEMVREKLFNLYADFEKQRFDNAFQRARTAVKSMKY